MSVQLQANKPIATVSAVELFEKALPKAFEVFKSQASNIGATYEVNIFGAGGGHWFVDPKAGKVNSFAGEKTDCVLEMGVEEFSQLTQGKLDAGTALRTGRVRFSGNPEKLIALGQLLSA